MNIHPSVWGESFHRVIYSIIFAHEPARAQDIRKFFLLIGSILPCESCRDNYTKHLNEYPLTDEIALDRTKLFTWYINIQNQINKSINVPPITLKYITTLMGNTEALPSGTNKSSTVKDMQRKSGSKHENIKMVGVWLLLLVIIYLVNKKYMR